MLYKSIDHIFNRTWPQNTLHNKHNKLTHNKMFLCYSVSRFKCFPWFNCLFHARAGVRACLRMWVSVCVRVGVCARVCVWDDTHLGTFSVTDIPIIENSLSSKMTYLRRTQHRRGYIIEVRRRALNGRQRFATCKFQTCISVLDLNVQG
jgi:hypothetical protein